MEEILKDERFSHILTDPRFRRIPKNVRKIKVDNRFKDMFNNKKFTEKCRVDERGRTLNLGPSENLRKLYNMDEESSESEEESCNEEESAIAPLKSVKEVKASKKLNKGEKGMNKGLEKAGLHLKDSHADSEISTVDNNEKNITQKKQKLKKSSKKDNEWIESDLEKSSLHNKDNGMNIEDNIKEKNISLKKQKLKKSKKTFLSKNSDYDESKLTFKNNSSVIRKNQNEGLNKSTIKIHNDPRFPETSDCDEESSIGTDEEEEDITEESEMESTSSSEEDSDESNDSDSGKSDSFNHHWEEQHENAPDTDEITKRFAVCNMDWDRIRAVDLFSVFNSFKPPDSSILSVKIYPSEYGLKRMEEEKLKGPPELVEQTLNSDEEEDLDDKKGGKYHREKLRQYQLNRMRYYYAVVECDTPETANALYEHLNGMEYESSSVRFDLRFIPDDMTFDQEPSSSAENPDLTEYKPNLFVTTALQQVKVGLTWDETDPQRRDILQRAFTEPDDIEKDIKEYLASSSGDSESEGEINDEENHVKLSTKERIQKYKALLESLNEQEKEKNEEKYEMEISWEPGVKEKTETLVKEKIEEKTFTPFEELQKKKKEKLKLKKKEKKAKNKEEVIESSASDSEESMEFKIDGSKKIVLNKYDDLLLDTKKSEDTNDQRSKKKEKKKVKQENSHNFQDELYLISDNKKYEETNDRKSKKKKKVEQENSDDFQIDVNDPRFSAIYTSPLYNIDPSDPHFKRTPGNLALIAEKQRRLKKEAISSDEIPNKKFKFK